MCITMLCQEHYSIQNKAQDNYYIILSTIFATAAGAQSLSQKLIINSHCSQQLLHTSSSPSCSTGVKIYPITVITRSDVLWDQLTQPLVIPLHFETAQCITLRIRNSLMKLQKTSDSLENSFYRYIFQEQRLIPSRDECNCNQHYLLLYP